MKYTVGSLFAGVGGIDLGFKNASYEEDYFELIWANEIDEYAAATYLENFNHHVIIGDIEKIVKPERAINSTEEEEYKLKREEILSQKIDILVGGFPCQAFSIAGYRKGFDDERGVLFWSIIDLINLLKKKHFKPKILFLENIKNLRTHDNGRTFEIIKNELESLDYIVKEKIINTKDITNLPQNRERIYIVAFQDPKVAKQFTLFDKIEQFKIEKDEKQRIREIKSCLDLDLSKRKNDNEKYFYTKEKYPFYFLSEEEYYAMDVKERKEQRVNIEEQIRDEYEFYQIRRGMYIRQNKSGVCPTLTANMGTGGHNVPLIKVKDGIRKLTPEETFRLQGFPIGNGYKLPSTINGKPVSEGRLYKQAGNAVSVDVAQIIAIEIIKALNHVRKTNSVERESMISIGL
ncbi:DNA (cytosine-5-)-methyltransferase [Paucisalibacillus sp. EB02]|uniref:DNA (cytosine-5-)-methyltransferase n=1 Tax=Paucisalibacillus sp. EB02 TaxID=1347087 RepID=UPI0005A7CA61|nr:DNA (cytosine-5-)-methyltransferase [Paucisalibacillus sp. EB02]